MILSILLLIVEMIGLIILGYYDLKSFSVPKNLSKGIFLIVIILFAVQFTIGKGYTFILLAFGIMMWWGFGIAKGNDWRNPYKTYKEFDKIALLVSAITLPFLFIFAMIIQQVLFIIITSLTRKKTRLPIMTTYCISFILATLVIAGTVGLGIQYL